jgi:sigma-B regulation protein RsbU (phosphoserine phosphatase)
VLDPPSGALVYSNAGHNPPILLRAAEPEQVTLLRNTGMPLGVEESALWPARQVQMASGDVLVMYTDGVTDAEDVDGAWYEMDRLEAVIKRSRGGTAQAVRDAILADVQRFTRNAVQADDMALVVLVRE